jgi:hypothetical protein
LPPYLFNVYLSGTFSKSEIPHLISALPALPARSMDGEVIVVGPCFRRKVGEAAFFKILQLEALQMQVEEVM